MIKQNLISTTLSSNSSNSKKYKILSIQQKEMIVKRSLETSILQASNQFSISINNISRWKKRIERKIGAGRKISDQQMQDQLIKWIQSQQPNSLTKKIIQIKAQQLSNRKQFKASKGWYQRFIKRNNDISQYISNYYAQRCRAKSISMMSIDQLREYYQFQKFIYPTLIQKQQLIHQINNPDCKLEPIFIQCEDYAMNEELSARRSDNNIYDVLCFQPKLYHD